MGVFDAFQIPYSAVERDHEDAITAAAAAGGGTIIRGGVARGLPEAEPDYPERFQAILRARKERFDSTDIDDLLGDMTPMEFMLRFTISHPDLHTTIVGHEEPRAPRRQRRRRREGPAARPTSTRPPSSASPDRLAGPGAFPRHRGAALSSGWTCVLPVRAGTTMAGRAGRGRRFSGSPQGGQLDQTG